MARRGSESAPPRAVFDTNAILSALVFPTGSLAPLRRAWQQGLVTPLVSRATIEELLRVLGYPKFRLSETEREDLLSDYLPWCETVRISNPPPPTPRCRDPFDVPFLELAASGRADFLVTGDRDLLALGAMNRCTIVDPRAFIETLGGLSSPPASRR